ncbi:hypothetical protein SAMN05216223_103535 [Actinacidiphila yanglinensis]|uniref:SMI1/KNR4 family protein n=1 Tax=Actinacidiphila yanglinensis TaxID=310779 RepID=A0A1H5Y2T9_9ACTN|nr:SMI1/KNR4 family protein [Actinacidiphila yanglinensis]SEG18359.1 hypothetical protein SAMN05216223_103535 [Actinacidiphila yanglinensis]
MTDLLAVTLGERKHFRSAKSESWKAIEDWIGRPLPGDYKELVDGYGDAVIAGHLFIPHPEGSEPLLDFIREQRDVFLQWCEGLELDERVRAAATEVIPWAYHDWNGDVCLLLPDGSERWSVAVVFRQHRRILLFEGGVVDFLDSVLNGGRYPIGWPKDRPRWEQIEGSPVI